MADDPTVTAAPAPARPRVLATGVTGYLGSRLVPVLVERPVVETPKGVRLCRPAETVRDLL